MVLFSEIFLSIFFGLIVQQGHGTFLRNIFLGILWALIITTCRTGPFELIRDGILIHSLSIVLRRNGTRWPFRIGVDATSAIVSLLSLETSRYVATWGFPCHGNSKEEGLLLLSGDLQAFLPPSPVLKHGQSHSPAPWPAQLSCRPWGAEGAGRSWGGSHGGCLWAC